MQEPLCGWSFSQVARDRGAEVNCSLCVQLSALFTRRDPAPTEGTIPLPAPRISLNTALYLHICPQPMLLQHHQHSHTNRTPHTVPFRSPVALSSYHPNPTHDSSAPRRGLAGAATEQAPGGAVDSRALAGASLSSRHGCRVCGGAVHKFAIRRPGHLTWAKACGFGFGLAGRRHPQRTHGRRNGMGDRRILKRMLLVVLDEAVDTVAVGAVLALRSARQAASTASSPT
jgi:hypothetical protein